MPILGRRIEMQRIKFSVLVVLVLMVGACASSKIPAPAPIEKPAAQADVVNQKEPAKTEVKQEGQKVVSISVSEKLDKEIGIFEDKNSMLQEEIGKRQDKRSTDLEHNKLSAQRQELAIEDLSIQKEADALEASVQTRERRVEAVRQKHELKVTEIELKAEEKSLKDSMREMDNPRLQLLVTAGMLTGRRTYLYSDYKYDYTYDEYYQNDEYKYESPEGLFELGLRYPFGNGPAPFSIGIMGGGDTRSNPYLGAQFFLPVVKSGGGTRGIVSFEGGCLWYLLGKEKKKGNNDSVSSDKPPIFPVIGLSLESRNPGVRFFIQAVPGNEYPLRVGLGLVRGLGF
jgi:Na+-transporting methylmalonyl-CoA/oxaloacetate decarboxylase gamma subunit